MSRMRDRAGLLAGDRGVGRILEPVALAQPVDDAAVEMAHVAGDAVDLGIGDRLDDDAVADPVVAEAADLFGRAPRRIAADRWPAHAPFPGSRGRMLPFAQRCNAAGHVGGRAATGINRSGSAAASACRSIEGTLSSITRLVAQDPQAAPSPRDHPGATCRDRVRPASRPPCRPRRPGSSPGRTPAAGGRAVVGDAAHDQVAAMLLGRDTDPGMARPRRGGPAPGDRPGSA